MEVVSPSLWQGRELPCQQERRLSRAGPFNQPVTRGVIQFSASSRSRRGSAAATNFSRPLIDRSPLVDRRRYERIRNMAILLDDGVGRAQLQVPH